MKWLPIPRYPAYEISDTGIVRNIRFKRPLMTELSDSGYDRVRLSDVHGRRRNPRVHVLVLETFVGSRPSIRHHAAHSPDPDKRNNCLSNLRWSTREENEADKPAKRGGGLKTKLPARRVRQLLERGLSDTKIAKQLGVHRSSVSRIRRGLRQAP
jgi:HNH endonuclease/NUMOD4 motif/Homeodomain-like domain